MAHFDLFAYGRAPYLGSLALGIGFAPTTSGEGNVQESLVSVFYFGMTYSFWASVSSFPFPPSPLSSPSFLIV